MTSQTAALGVLNLSEMTVAKDGNLFAVTHRDGSLPADRDHPLGIYLDDARHLKAHELTIGGARPQLLVGGQVSGSTIVHELTNPPLTLADGTVLPLQTTRIRLERTLHARGAVTERLRVHSYAREPVTLEVALTVAADFAPMLAVRGHAPMPDPAHRGAEPARTGLTLSATGRDGTTRATTITADPAPTAVTDGTLRFRLDLEPGEAAEIILRHELSPAPPHAERMTPAIATPPSTDDGLAQLVLDRAFDDLNVLQSTMDGHRYLAAGVPWYVALFGRDSLVAATQALPFAPDVAAGTLRLLAGHLGATDDPSREEDPGKVLHELRGGEVAAANLTPLHRYYGTVDATPLLLCLLADHARWTGDLTLFRDLRPQIEAMLGWIDGPGDRDGDGLLDYAARAPGGLRNQGWKDSPDAICDEDGRPLEPPIALIEPQAYAVKAKRGLAALYARDGDLATSRTLDSEADALAARVDERFWLPDRGHYAMALGGDHAPSRALASNQGHALWAQAVPADRGARVRDALMGDAMFSGWGIRTLSAGEPAYNPVAYHLGTVWPHDTAITAAGLRAYGFDAECTRIAEALLDAAARSTDHRLPELFAGFSRDASPAPVPYPVACRPQAWAAGAILQLLVACLGLGVDGFTRTLTVRRPALPRQVDALHLTGIAVGDATADLRFERTPHGDVTLADARLGGDARISLEPAAAAAGSSRAGTPAGSRG